MFGLCSTDIRGKLNLLVQGNDIKKAIFQEGTSKFQRDWN